MDEKMRRMKRFCENLIDYTYFFLSKNRDCFDCVIVYFICLSSKINIRNIRRYSIHLKGWNLNIKTNISRTDINHG